MRIGLHTSIAGALERSALKAAELGANTFQIFSSSPRQWKASAPSLPAIRLLNQAREKYDLYPLAIHDNYLINLASAHEKIRKLSIEAFRGELERAVAIGAEYLIAHPGNYKGHTVEQGIMHFLEGVGEAARGLEAGKPDAADREHRGRGRAARRALRRAACDARIRAQADRRAHRILSGHLPFIGIGIRHRQRRRPARDGGRGRSPAGARKRARDSRQRFQRRAGIAHRPAPEYRQRVYWIRRVSPHPASS